MATGLVFPSITDGFIRGQVSVIVDLDVVDVADQTVEAKSAFAVGVDGIDDRSSAFQIDKNRIGKVSSRGYAHLTHDAARIQLG